MSQFYSALNKLNDDDYESNPKYFLIFHYKSGFQDLNIKTKF